MYSKNTKDISYSMIPMYLFVNIILKKNNSYAFALQKPPFWLPKNLVLHAKTGSLAMRNSSFYKALITMLLYEYLFL